MDPLTNTFEPVRIGLLSVSDRASAGVYEDKGIPALQEWLARAVGRHADASGFADAAPCDRSRRKPRLVRIIGWFG